MQVLFWVVTAAILAIAASWMVVACAIAGYALRAIHNMVIPTRWFLLVRRYGVWGASWRCVASATRKIIRGNWPLSRRSLEPLLAVILVPATGYIAAVFLPGIVPILLLPSSFSSSELGKVLSRASMGVGVIGALIAVYLWLRGLGYVARPSVRRRVQLPRLPVPDEFSRTIRNNLTLTVYWYSRFDSAIMFASIYPWCFFLAIIARGFSSSSSADSNSSQSFPVLLGALILMSVLLITILPAEATAYPIKHRMVSAKVCEELFLLLQLAEEGGASSDGISPMLIIDPLGSRQILAQVAGHIADVARQLDARQVRGFPPHPISTLLRAISHSLRQFLENERSLQEHIPDDIIGTLKMTLLLFGGRRDRIFYQSLAEQVSAFDEYGHPAIDVVEKPPGRLTSIISRTATSIPKIALVVTGLSAIVAIAIAAALLAIHRMSVDEFLHFLH